MAEETVAWSVWYSMANAVGVFLYVFSISTAYTFGNYVLDPFVLAAIAFLIPYFSFWVLPIVLILFTAITNKRLV